MQYLTGQHALNIPCSLLTCGDWRQSSLQWSSPFFRNSEESIFGDYGIEENISIPEHSGAYNVANHIRALLDLLELGKFTLAQGMNRDFICNDVYNEEIFSQVMMFEHSPFWNDIDRFMGKEYYAVWLDYKRGKKTDERLAERSRQSH